MKKKVIYTVIAAVLLILLYLVIFCFSAENGEESSVISEAVTRFILNLFHSLQGTGDGSAVVVETISPVESVIRKLAHFSEYACVGFLSYSIVAQWYQPVGKGCLLVFIQLIISGALDEFHQSFIPGRYASAKDVCIDVAGGIVGILIMILWKGIRRKWKNIQ